MRLSKGQLYNRLPNTASGIVLHKGQVYGSVWVGVAKLQIIEPTSIESEEIFGTSTVVPGVVVLLPTSIESEEIFGTSTVVPGTANILPIGIESEEIFGTHIVVPGVVVLLPTSIESEEIFGGITINSIMVIRPSGIAPTNMFGTAVISSVITLYRLVETTEKFLVLGKAEKFTLAEVYYEDTY